MKIAFLNNIPSKYRKDLFMGLYVYHKKKGNQFNVYYLSRIEKVRSEFISIEKFEEILPVLFQFRNFFSPTSDFVFNYKYIKKLLVPDKLVIFGYNYLTYIIIAIIRRIFNKENYLYCDSTLNDSNKNIIKTFIKSILLKYLFKLYIVPGKRSKEYIKSFGINDDTIYIAPQYSPLKSNIKNKKIKTFKNKIKLLFVGRLASEKNILIFSKIFNKLKLKKFTLSIVGAGPLQKSIEKISQNNHLIKYLGYIDNDRTMSKIYDDHDILILLSESESWGLVVNEAINHSLALLLSNNVGSSPDLMNENGLILNKINEKAIENSLSIIAKNLKRMQNNSKIISLQFNRKKQLEGFNKALNVIN